MPHNQHKLLGKVSNLSDSHTCRRNCLYLLFFSESKKRFWNCHFVSSHFCFMESKFPFLWLFFYLKTCMNKSSLELSKHLFFARLDKYSQAFRRGRWIVPDEISHFDKHLSRIMGDGWYSTTQRCSVTSGFQGFSLSDFFFFFNWSFHLRLLFTGFFRTTDYSSGCSW